MSAGVKISALVLVVLGLALWSPAAFAGGAGAGTGGDSVSVAVSTSSGSPGSGTSTSDGNGGGGQRTPVRRGRCRGAVLSARHQTCRAPWCWRVSRIHDEGDEGDHFDGDEDPGQTEPPRRVRARTFRSVSALPHSLSIGATAPTSEELGPTLWMTSTLRLFLWKRSPVVVGCRHRHRSYSVTDRHDDGAATLQVDSI